MIALWLSLYPLYSLLEGIAALTLPRQPDMTTASTLQLPTNHSKAEPIFPPATNLLTADIYRNLSATDTAGMSFGQVARFGSVSDGLH